MTRVSGLIAIMMMISACEAPAPPIQHMVEGHQPGEEEAVLGALDRFITAVLDGDIEAQAMHMPEGMTFQWRPAEGGGMQITSSPTSRFSDPSEDNGHVVRERYWSPTVMIRGGIAVVWAPYELWMDGQTLHCGIVNFDFVERNGQWLVSNAMWTVEPDACAELRPVDSSQLRPQD